MYLLGLVNNRTAERWAFGLVVKMLFKMPVPHNRVPGFDSLLWLLILAACHRAHPGWPQVTVQVLGSLPPVWETRIEFLAAGFSSVKAQLLQAFGGMNQQIQDAFVYLPLSAVLCLSHKLKKLFVKRHSTKPILEDLAKSRQARMLRDKAGV